MIDALKLIRHFEGEEISTPKLGNIIFSPYKIGKLVLTSGILLVCDLLVNSNSEAFEITLTPGRYPVILSIAQNKKRRREAAGVKYK